MNVETPDNPTQGQFPFCAPNGAMRDTCYVAWWRNRSNYLVFGGFWKKTNAVYQYMRGVFGNLILLAPILGTVGLLDACGYSLVRRNPFVTTFLLLALLVLSHLSAFAISRIRSPRLDLLSRGRYWPTNVFIALLPVGLAIDISPVIIEFFRFWNPFGSFGLQECLQLLAAITAGSGVVLRFLFSNPKYGKNVALFILALLSWSILGIVVMRIVNFVYFGVPPHGWFLLVPFFSIGVFAASLVIAKSHANWYVVIVGGVLGLIATWTSSYFCLGDFSEVSRHAGKEVGVITRPLARLTDAMRTDLPEINERLGTSSKELLQLVLSEKEDLDAESRVTWPEDYQRGHWFVAEIPWAQRQITFGVLKESLNLKLYQTSNNLEVQEWGVLTPVRPLYYQHAVSYLESCSRMDRMSSLEKLSVRQSLTHFGVRRLFSSVSGSTVSATTVKPSSPTIDGSLIRDAVRAQIVQSFLQKLYPIRPVVQRSIELKTLIDWSNFDYSDSNANDAHLAAMIGSTSDFANTLRSISLPQSEQRNFDIVSRTARNEDRKDGSVLSSTDAALLGPKPFASVEKLEEIIRVVQRASLVEALIFALVQEQILDTGMTETIVRLLGKLPDDFASDPLLRLGDKQVAKLRQLCELNFFDLSIRAGMLDELHAWVLHTNLPVDLRPKEFRDRAAFSKEYLGKTTTTEVSDQGLCQLLLLIRAINNTGSNTIELRRATESLGELHKFGLPDSGDMQVGNLRENEQALMAIYRETEGSRLKAEIKQRLLTYRFASSFREESDKLIRRMYVGRFGEFSNLRSMIEELAAKTLWPKLLLVASVVLAMFAFGLLIDPNMTSLHRFYSDSLSTAFFVTPKKTGNAKVDTNTRLSELADYANGSYAPYHLINVALNMQGSSLEDLRDRQAIPFVFSPKFVGNSAATVHDAATSGKGLFVETSTFEKVHPGFFAATAMTISAGAASPNMGRYTSPLVRLAMVLVNLRLGYWIQNPRSVADSQNSKTFSLAEVTSAEEDSIKMRRANAEVPERHGLVGLAFSGGGIRSASLNFGIAQELFVRKIWPEIDYLSTVSGGGYVGTAISVFMRRMGEPSTQIVVTDDRLSHVDSRRSDARSLSTTATIAPVGFLGKITNWCLKSIWFNRRCWCLIREALGQLEDSTKWINVSDGGHIENLGVYPLLQRRCDVIIVGDGEDDKRGVFDGLSRVMRLAEIDLGITIEFPAGALALLLELDPDKARHFAVAKVTYPSSETSTEKVGYLLYLRSTFSGDEDQILKSYLACNSEFPHETTADQFFDESKFEAYRRLGQHIARQAILELLPKRNENESMYNELFNALKRKSNSPATSS